MPARARARDSTSFVVGCDQAGPGETEDGGAAPTGVGDSLVVSPLGEVRARLGPAPDFTCVDLDLREVGRARRAVPVLAGGRPVPVA
ncbi:hypothetical protein AB0N07_01635 [Streptomyces sp. NPDC051172]|uniref:hypothetical protein n=1 Tax=Streptomyces sp. NPDC051172 TaxID=3155796 RepID=UPI00343001DA